MKVNTTTMYQPLWRILFDSTSIGIVVEEQLDLLTDYLLDVPLMTLAKYILIVIFLFLAVYYLIKPLNRIRDLSDVGFDCLIDRGICAAQKKNKSKKELVREILHMRKVGELPPVYPNGWFMLLESDDLSPGQVKHVAALGENFAVFRTQEGKICILDAYCPHLGANMGIGGSVHGNCLECPFHSWRFNGEDGKCSSIPYTDKVPEVAKVKKWPSCEVNTFIFVWYHAEGEEPSWHPEPIKPIEEKTFVFGGRNEFLINSHIEEIPENGSDESHFSIVHGASLINGSDLRTCQSKNNLWDVMHHEWTVKWAPCTEKGKAHIANILLTHKLLLFNKISVVDVTAYINQIGPGYVVLDMHTSFGRLVTMQTVTPIEPLIQRVVHRVYCPRLLYLFAGLALWGESIMIGPGYVVLNMETSFGKLVIIQTVTPFKPLLQRVVHRVYCPLLVYLFAGFTLWFSSIMIERDIMVWNHKTYIQKPILVPEDRDILRHRRWYDQFYTENSVRLTFQKNTID